MHVVDMPIAVDRDDAGLSRKESIKRSLEEQGWAVAGYGCDSPDSVDCPDVAIAVAHAVARGEHDRAILVCGTGIRMSIAANKVPCVYARLPTIHIRRRRADLEQRPDPDPRRAPSRQSWLGPWSRSECARVAGGSSAREVAKIGAEDAARARGDLPAHGRAGSVDATPGSSRVTAPARLRSTARSSPGSAGRSTPPPARRPSSVA